MSGISSVLDKGSILPVVRVCFRASNGRTRKCPHRQRRRYNSNSKGFCPITWSARQTRKIDLAVVGGERVEQPQSRRVTFSISSFNGAEEHRIEAHEIEKTVFKCPTFGSSVVEIILHTFETSTSRIKLVQSILS
ncbi:Hypothetical predicted protein [Paramuricea clavata]|uniref:Uncharacterized protein n=1 Tax=Paramuricea clavata TaxID=317549 RepID=A0A6S7JTX4_PARCT|nr:Hypothetical predicted protein [Paramuricea clavata]CAB4033574.1 Hypothetical predicted protein [Paramuricea clavata]